MPVHRDAVTRQGVVPDKWGGDVLYPVRQPLGNCPVLTCPPNHSVIACSLKSANFRQNPRLRLRHHVTTIRATIVPDTHADPSVPVAIPTQIDRRGTVSLTRHQADSSCCLRSCLTK